MSNSRILKRWLLAGLAAIGFLLMSSMQAGDLNPKALAYKLPDQLKWAATPSGAKQAVLMGDPSKPGWYIILVKWEPHKMSHPHYHPHDRFATVLSGTWWVGTGPKFDPNGTTPLPPGSFVTHFAKEIHYDGAKDQEVILQIVGQGAGNFHGR